MIKSKIMERRRWVRAKRVLSVQHKLHRSKTRPPERAWQIALTEDMSYGGLAFETDAVYTVGDILDLKVVMSGVLDIYEGQAEVVRLQQMKNETFFLYGVKYLPERTKASQTSTRRDARRIL